MTRIYDKLHKAVNALEWFTTREWTFHCNNVLNLSSELVGSDKQVCIYKYIYGYIFMTS